MSQKHEGWLANAEVYDDGGYSGGNMQPSGLVQPIADVAAGKVNGIVVYKVDRPTRSFADFARIVDVLDAAGASFVATATLCERTSRRKPSEGDKTAFSSA